MGRMISKKGTSALTRLGFKNLECIKGKYGFYLRDNTLKSQRANAPCRGRIDECIVDALKGDIPTSINRKYRYEASFCTCPLVAVGTIDAKDANEAGYILRGMCGSWQTRTGREFSAGCPDEFELSEV